MLLWGVLGFQATAALPGSKVVVSSTVGYGLHVKCLSQVHVFEHLVPSGAVLEAVEPGPCSWLVNSRGLWMLPSPLSNHLSLRCIYLSEYASSVIHMWLSLLEFSLLASVKLHSEVSTLVPFVGKPFKYPRT